MTQEQIYEAIRQGRIDEILEYIDRNDLIYAIKQGWMTIDDATATYEAILNI